MHGSGRVDKSLVFMRAPQEAARQRWRARRLRQNRAKGVRTDRRVMRHGAEVGAGFGPRLRRVSWEPLVRRCFPWRARSGVELGRLRERLPGSWAWGPGRVPPRHAGVLRLTAAIDEAWCGVPASSARAWLRRSPQSIRRSRPRSRAGGWRRGSAATTRNFPVRRGRHCPSSRRVETSDEQSKPRSNLDAGLERDQDLVGEYFTKSVITCPEI